MAKMTVVPRANDARIKLTH